MGIPNGSDIGFVLITIGVHALLERNVSLTTGVRSVTNLVVDLQFAER